MQQSHDDSDGGSVYQERYHEYILRKLREERENGIQLAQNTQS